jgi:hypothetical protein
MGDRTGVRKKKMTTFLGGPLTAKVSIFCPSSGVFRQHFLSDIMEPWEKTKLEFQPSHQELCITIKIETVDDVLQLEVLLELIVRKSNEKRTKDLQMLFGDDRHVRLCGKFITQPHVRSMYGKCEVGIFLSFFFTVIQVLKIKYENKCEDKI